MKQYTLIYLLLAIGFAFAACQPAAEHNPALIGQWTGKNWLVNDQLSNRDAGQVFFEFNADGTYAAGFGQQREAGVWHNEGDKLYTTASGKQQIMVKVQKADSTGLVFEMNRGGQKEILELIKK